MFTKLIRNFPALFFPFMILLITGCGDNSSTADNASGTGAMALKLQWDNTESGTKGLTLAPAGVATVRIIVSGPGMTTIQKEFAASAGVGSISGVPPGSGLTVSAEGLNSSNVVTHRGSASGSGSLSVQAGQVFDVGTIVMLPLCAISGTVKTAAGAAISGVTVSLSGTVSKTTTTDTNGNYQFMSVATGNYNLSVSKTGYTFSPSNIPLTIYDTCVGEQNFVGSPAVQCAISGKVTTSSGAAISGVTVSLSGGAYSPTTTDTNGNYSFPAVSNGSYTLSVAKSGYSFNISSVDLTVSTSVCPVGPNFIGTPDPPCTLSGSVKTAAGDAIAGATVSLSGTVSRTMVTDSFGNYMFEGVPSHGDYILTAVKSGFSFTPVNISLSLSGICPGPQNFIGDRTGDSTITGCIATPAGAPVAGVTLYLTGQFGEGEFTTTSSPTGSFMFSSVKDGTYTLTPVSAGSTFTPPNFSPLITEGSDSFILGCFVISTVPALL